jgi:hypothetical protein
MSELTKIIRKVIGPGKHFYGDRATLPWMTLNASPTAEGHKALIAKLQAKYETWVSTHTHKATNTIERDYYFLVKNNAGAVIGFAKCEADFAGDDVELGVSYCDGDLNSMMQIMHQGPEYAKYYDVVVEKMNQKS